MELAGMMEVGQSQQQQQHQPQRACPRCNSNNTKFCYFNNYSLSQPRYFCKGCRRYWTHGGTLRSVPVGGSSRKSKRPRAEANAAPLVSTPTSASPVISTNLFPFHGGGGVGGGFLSSLVQRPVLQGRQVEFASFGRQDLVGGWQQSFVGAGGDGNSAPAATGAQFWTLGGSVGGTTSNAEGDGGDHASNTNQWRNFSAVTGGGGDDNN